MEDQAWKRWELLHVGGGCLRSWIRDADFWNLPRVQRTHSSSPSVKNTLEICDGGALFLCSVGHHLTHATCEEAKPSMELLVIDAYEELVNRRSEKIETWQMRSIASFDGGEEFSRVPAVRVGPLVGCGGSREDFPLA